VGGRLAGGWGVGIGRFRLGGAGKRPNFCVYRVEGED